MNLIIATNYLKDAEGAAVNLNMTAVDLWIGCGLLDCSGLVKGCKRVKFYTSVHKLLHGNTIGNDLVTQRK